MKQPCEPGYFTELKRAHDAQWAFFVKVFIGGVIAVGSAVGLLIFSIYLGSRP